VQNRDLPGVSGCTRGAREGKRTRGAAISDVMAHAAISKFPAGRGRTFTREKEIGMVLHPPFQSSILEEVYVATRIIRRRIKRKVTRKESKKGSRAVVLKTRPNTVEKLGDA